MGDRLPKPLKRIGSTFGSFTAFFDVGAGAGSYAVGALAEAFGFSIAFAVPAMLCVLGITILSRTRDDRTRTSSEALV